MGKKKKHESIKTDIRLYIQVHLYIKANMDAGKLET